MRVMFFGTAAFAVPSLEALSTRHEVVCCVTQPERPQGRGLTKQPSPVKRAAQQLGLAVEEPDRLALLYQRAVHLAPDVGVVIAFGRLIPSSWLALPRHGMFGVHPSLLPQYRGASPIPQAILNQDSTTGVTIFRLNQDVDAGDIALQRELLLDERATAEELSMRLAVVGAELLLETFTRLEQDRLVLHPQRHEAATYAPKWSKADGHVDWRQDAAALNCLVRAAVPWPGAYTTWHGTVLKVWRTDYDDTAQTPTTPGTVQQASADGIVVATGKGLLHIRELQLAGGRRMTAKEFLAGHQIHVGDLFGG